MRIGDGVKAMTETLGIPQCEPCKARQQKLNEIGAWAASVLGGKTEPLYRVWIQLPDGSWQQPGGADRHLTKEEVYTTLQQVRSLGIASVDLTRV